MILPKIRSGELPLSNYSSVPLARVVWIGMYACRSKFSDSIRQYIVWSASDIQIQYTSRRTLPQSECSMPVLWGEPGFPCLRRLPREFPRPANFFSPSSSCAASTFQDSRSTASVFLLSSLIVRLGYGVHCQFLPLHFVQYSLP